MKRHKRPLRLVISAVLGMCGLYFLGVFVSGSKGKQMIPDLKEELSAVAVPSNDRVVKDYASAALAREALSLPSTPVFRVEFNLSLTRAGYGGLAAGGGTEFILSEGSQAISATSIVPLGL